MQNYNLPVVLYGCETWSPTLGEEYRVRVFENRVVVTGGCEPTDATNL
jgi:hypothetical protein